MVFRYHRDDIATLLHDFRGNFAPNNHHYKSFIIMIERIIRFSIKNKFIVGLFVIVLIGWGTYSLTRLPIDVTPDITNNQVQVIAYAPSLAVQEVESSLTAPIESAVANIDRKSTRLNSSHQIISYAVFCLKK